MTQQFMEALNEDELEVALTQSIGISARGHRIPLYDLAREFSEPILEVVSSFEANERF